ncbi:hypothetical protein [Chitinophaga sp. MM2321]|uniref:hypothetical protein n=1 Tax=Chitinophaga sp. MM2321 TaxID=3137178 RepID=UPI0032D56C07
MAKQNGIIPLEGTIGNITFYKTKDGNLAREKGGVDANRIATDPAFIRTRENGAEFGRAGKAGKVLRTAFRAMLLNVRDGRMTPRLVREMVKVIKADVTNLRGQRNIIDGEAELLNGFEFNGDAPLGGSLYAPFTATIDRAAGMLTVDIPAFIPANMVAAPDGATHFKIVAAGAEIDFEAETFINGNAATPETATNAATVDVASLAINVMANSTKPLFLALGIVFYQQVNDVLYNIKNGAYNALALVAVSGTAPTP